MSGKSHLHPFKPGVGRQIAHEAEIKEGLDSLQPAFHRRSLPPLSLIHGQGWRVRLGTPITWRHAGLGVFVALMGGGEREQRETRQEGGRVKDGVDGKQMDIMWIF
ncbi:hypothetical protein E2C01_030151 [Portunus trituberculatus]|uniref:Uncharacterized protein n=1 Tax=Portunus trituberculatus TaxID=210409 RepID=A0A5B7EUY2_PORTR|nr:hypothetical protein [Portunus trituberculatus]